MRLYRPSVLLHRLSPTALFWAMWAIILGGALLCLTYLYLQAIEHQKEGVRRDVLHLAQSLAHLVDVELHESLRSPRQMGSPEHLEALKPLVRFHLQIPEIHYVYTIRDVDGQEYFVLDTAFDARVRARRPEDTLLSLIMEHYEMPDPNPEANPAMYRGDAYVYELPYEDSYGQFISAQAPLFDDDGRYVGYAGVDYDISDYRERVNQIRIAGAGALVLAFLVSLIIANLTRRMRQEEVALTRSQLAAEEALREAKERAESANLAKSDLLAMASHDLRNPLTSISGLTELLLLRSRDGQPPRWQEVEADLRMIQRTGRQMLTLLEDLLSSERVQQEELMVRAEAFDLAQLIKSVIDQYHPHAVQKSQKIESRLAPALTVKADRSLLREAAGNLISNALKFSPAGRSIRVQLQQDTARGEAVLEVEDDGPGISPEDQKQLFQRYRRLGPTPTAGESSTGLGLFIVKRVVTAHGGSVHCESQPGAGARFEIRLPLTPRPEADPSAAHDSPDRSGP